MRNSVFIIVGFLIAFAGGYFFFGQADAPPEDSAAETTETEEQEETEDNEEDLAAMIPDEAMALSRNGCLSCHAVESIDAPGGDIGPDLSRAFPEMKDKHGVELDEFLQDPTAAVMATVIADNPLEDDEREQIIKVLEEASDKLHSADESQEAKEDESSEEDDE